MVVDIMNAIENLCDEINPSYQCTQCDNVFSKKQSLEKHLANEHAEAESAVNQEKKSGKYECNYCDRSFRRERNLTLHIRDDHEKEENNSNGDDEEEEDEEGENEEDPVEDETVGVDVECDPSLITYQSDQNLEDTDGIDEIHTENEVPSESDNELSKEPNVDEIDFDDDQEMLVATINTNEEIVDNSSILDDPPRIVDNNLAPEETVMETQEGGDLENEGEEVGSEQQIDMIDTFDAVKQSGNSEEVEDETNVEEAEKETKSSEEMGENGSNFEEEELIRHFEEMEQESISSEELEVESDLEKVEENINSEEVGGEGGNTDEVEENNSVEVEDKQVGDEEITEENTDEQTENLNLEVPDQPEKVEDSLLVETDMHVATVAFGTDLEDHDNSTVVEEEATNPLEVSVGLDDSCIDGAVLPPGDPEQMSANEDGLAENESIALDDDITENEEVNEEFLLNGQQIVMDDIAFDILANTLEMTMETPDGEEVNLPEEQEEPIDVKPEIGSLHKSGKKRKSEDNFEPIEKKIKEEPADEIELSGEPVYANTPASLSVLKAELKKKEIMKTKVSRKKTKSVKEYNYPAGAKKLICSYCKQIFPSRPDFNDHMSADHPDILAKHNNSNMAVNKTKVVVAAPNNKSEVKSISKSVKITHIPGPVKTEMVIKSEKVEIKEEEIIMNSIPKSTRIIFTPVSADGTPLSKPVDKTSKFLAPNVGKGVKITQIGAKDSKVAVKGVRITQLGAKDTKESKLNKSLKITPTSSKSVTITATPESSKINPAKKLLCTYCKSVFLSRPDFNKHILEDHPDISNTASKVATKAIKSAFKCNPCQLSFEEKQKYEQHLDVKHGHKCDHCNVSFRVRSKLEEHKKTAHSFKCSICNQRFVTNEKLTTHMESHNIKCDQCPEVFKSKMKMMDHKKMKHSHKCEKCNARFDEKNKLDVHMEKHKFRCDKCTEFFDAKIKVIEHKKAMHTFNCETCKKTFEEKKALEEHIKSNHMMKCRLCSTIFDFKIKLEEHIQKEHSFKCSRCEETFELEESVATHEKEKHSSCETCEDEFSWAEPGHSCYYTKNDVRPTKERVQVQNLYFDY